MAGESISTQIGEHPWVHSPLTPLALDNTSAASREGNDATAEALIRN